MKLIFSLQVNIKRFLLIVTIVLDMCGHAPKLCKISSLLFLKKEEVMKLIFCMQISMKVSYKLILGFLMGIVKYSQNSKFAMSDNISKKYLEMKLIFCMQIKFPLKIPTSWFQHLGHQSFLQSDTIFIDGHDQTFSKYSKQQGCNIFTISWKRS